MLRIPPQDSHKPFAGRATRTASTRKAQAVLKGETKNERESGNSRCDQMLGSKGGSTPKARKFQPNQVVWALWPHRPRFVLVAPYLQPTPATNPPNKGPLARQGPSGLAVREWGTRRRGLPAEGAGGGRDAGAPTEEAVSWPRPWPAPQPRRCPQGRRTLYAPRGARVLTGAGDKTASF